MKLSKKALLAATPQVEEGILESFEVGDLVKYYWGDDEKTHTDKQAKIIKALNKKYKLLYAEYTYEDYSGSAYVLGYDTEEKKFFEVHGSHCSCYGLEGQWSPEYCDAKELSQIITLRKAAWLKDKEDGYNWNDSTGNNEVFYKWLEAV